MLFERYPKWKEISEEEYKKAGRKYAPKSFDLDSDSEDLSDYAGKLGFYLEYKKEPIYPEVKGILEQIKVAEGEPLGYKYYKRDGYETVCLVSSEEMEIIKEYNLEPIEKPENQIKLMSIIIERNKNKTK